MFHWLGRALGVRSSERARRSGLRRASNGPFARRAVGGAVEAGAKRLELRHRRRLKSGERRLTAAVAAGGVEFLRYEATARRLRAFPDTGPERPPVTVPAPRRPRDELPVSGPAARRRALLPHRLVLALEIFIVLFDFGFWYSTWSAGIEPTVAWFGLERMSVALLALTLPVLAVIGARLAGGMAHRVLLLGTEAPRFERFGVVAGILLAAGSVWVIFTLALWNFTEGATATSVDVPERAMACVFTLIVVLDLLARTFGTVEAEDEQRRELRRRWWARRRDAWAGHRHRRRRTRIEKAVLGHRTRIATLTMRAENAWLDLRTEVQTVLEQVDLITVTGDLMILDAVGPVRPDATDEVLETAVPVPTAEPAHREPTGVGYALPSARRQYVLGGGHHVPFTLRTVADAVDVLDRHQPEPSRHWAEEVGKLHSRLDRLRAAGTEGRADPTMPIEHRWPKPATNGHQPAAVPRADDRDG